MAYNLKKFFRNFGGLNLADPELLKDDTVATAFQNSKYGDNLSIIKRRGHKRDLRNVGGNGCITYVKREVSSQSEVSERLIISDRVYKVEKQELELNHVGDKTPAVSVEIQNGSYHFIITEDGDEVFNFDLGQFQDILTGPQISQLVTAINSIPLTSIVIDPVTLLPVVVPRFSATYDDDTYANLLEATLNTSFESSIVINYSVTDEVTTFGGSAPFAAHWTKRNNNDFELTDHLQTRGCIYFTDVDSGLWKYDGAAVQKIPNFKYPVLSTTGVDTVVNNYKYKAIYKFVDAQGNVSYSAPSDTLETIGLAEDLVLTPLVAGSSPYNTNNATQIILRTIADGSDFFILDEIPFTDTLYTDSTTDENLLNGEPYIQPDFTVLDEDKYAYIDIFRDQIVRTGTPSNPDKVSYENLLLDEAFFELNSFTTESRNGGANSGIKSLDNNLYIFKAKSIFLVTGELNLDSNGLPNFQVDTMSDEGIGCLSNKSLVEYQRRIWFLGNKGIYSVSSSNLNLESRDISPLFQKELRKVTTLRAFSINWVEEDTLLINLPERIEGNRFSNSSRTLAHDKNTNRWAIWDNHNFANGADNFEFKIFFAADAKTIDSSKEFEINTSLHTNSKLDYVDNESGVNWVYASNWESYGEPSIPKKYVRLKLYSLDTPLQNFDETDFSIAVETQHDFIYQAISQTALEFSDNLGGWSLDGWGEFPWGHSRKRTRRTRLRPQKARSIRLVLSNNNLYENVLLSGYEYEVAVEYGPYLRQK